MKAMYCTFLLGMLFNGLAAYSIFSIPIPWIGASVVNGALIMALFFVRVSQPCHLPLILVMMCWAFLITMVNFSADYEELMPSLSTTPYGTFVFLRFLELVTFVSTLVIVHSLCARGYYDRLIRSIVLLGSALAVAAAYMYAAQLYGWWEPPRTRMSTGGSEMGATVFSYAFHRATGTFREPSHLAEWLIVPFFFSMAHKKTSLNVHSALICSVVLLTGSMNGVLAVSAGLAVALVLYKPFKSQNAVNVVLIAILLLVGVAGFYSLAKSYDNTEFDLLQTIMGRLAPLIDEGVAGTNRDYVYEFVRMEPPPMLGYGLGNGNLVFTQAMGANVVVSFLNLFVNAAYSTGVPGLILTAAVVVAPIWSAFLRGGAGGRMQSRWILGAYIGWCVIFVGHSETLSPMFGIAYGLLTFSVSKASADNAVPIERYGAHGSHRVGTEIRSGRTGSFR